MKLITLSMLFWSILKVSNLMMFWKDKNHWHKKKNVKWSKISLKDWNIWVITELSIETLNQKISCSESKIRQMLSFATLDLLHMLILKSIFSSDVEHLDSCPRKSLTSKICQLKVTQSAMCSQLDLFSITWCLVNQFSLEKSTTRYWIKTDLANLISHNKNITISVP